MNAPKKFSVEEKKKKKRKNRESKRKGLILFRVFQASKKHTG